MTSTDEAIPAIEHLSVADRAAHGKDARAKVSRTSHGEWAPAADRPDPLALLEAQETTRVPELVPIRHGRMAASPFAFYRGAANVLAADLAAVPHSGLRVQLCGDAHLANFGGFASPERSLVFDLNDFDETLPGPFEWDVKRLAASLEIAARSRGFDRKVRTRIVAGSVRSYREAMRAFAKMQNLDVWYAHLGVDDILARWGGDIGQTALKTFQRSVDKVESKDRLKAESKLTRLVDGELRFVSDPPLLVPVDELFPESVVRELEGSIHRALRAYRRTLQDDRRHLLESYRFVQLARKVVGVGSVGTRCWVALMVGLDNSDALFLQVKEAEASVLEPHLGKSGYANHGQRVVKGQQLVQAASDVFLGWEHVIGYDDLPHDHYIRQLWDWKASAQIETMAPDALDVYGQICGWTLARAHARSGDRVAIAAYLGRSSAFDDALARFAALYAEQNDLDHESLTSAIATGRLTAELET
ncbi:MAG: DUF2252 domain-containing protein [Acidimicrobiales bacterium]